MLNLYNEEIDETKEPVPGVDIPPYRYPNITKFSDPKDFELIAYVDGSYNRKTKVYGFAVVLTTDDNTVLDSFSRHDTRFNAMWNVAGEIEAAMYAVDIAKELMVGSLLICYDYEGIEKWATMEWHAKRKETQKYCDFMRKTALTMRIGFKHTTAHTGIRLNEMADELANKAAGIIPLNDLVPIYMHLDSHLDKYELTNEYDVPPETLMAIDSFRISKSYGDYARLRVGRCDRFSGMRGDDFKEILDKEAFEYLNRYGMTPHERNLAMRWAARGLNADDALKKAIVDGEIYSNKAKVG